MSFDPKAPEALIQCNKCQADLWSIKVLSKFSHKIIKYDPRSRDWDEEDPNCPICEKPFFDLKDGKPAYRIKSPKTGQRFTL